MVTKKMLLIKFSKVCIILDIFTLDGRRPFSMPPSLPPPYTPPGTLNSVDLRRTESCATNTTELSKNSK